MDNTIKYLLSAVVFCVLAFSFVLPSHTLPPQTSDTQSDCILQTGSRYDEQLAYQMNDPNIERNLTQDFYDFPPNQTCTRGEVCTYLCGNGTVRMCQEGWNCVENV